MEISIVIPAFNESTRIARTLETVTSFCAREFSRWEIVVVDDGSRDATCEKVSEFRQVKLLRNEENRGKGYSVRRGMLAASLDPVLFTDADLSTPIAEALQLHHATREGADVAIAVRVPASGKEVRRTPLRKLMSAVFRILVKVIALRGFHDTQCGFKMFRASAARAIFSRQRLDRWGFDVEVLFLARRLGLTIKEVPVAWNESAQTSLKLITPFTMTLDLLKIRWNQVTGRYGDVHRG